MMTTNQKKNTTIPGILYPATVFALATASSYPAPPGLSAAGVSSTTACMFAPIMIREGSSTDASLPGGHAKSIPTRLDVPADTAHLPVPDECKRRFFVQHPYDRSQLGLVQAFGGGIGQVFLPR
jgi:hypothetical protein